MICIRGPKKKLQMVWHPESPGTKIAVYRRFRQSHFATPHEVTKAYDSINLVQFWRGGGRVGG